MVLLPSDNSELPLGVALAGSLAGSGMGLASIAHLAECSHAVFWLNTALGGIILVLGIVATGVGARESAERGASLLLETK